MSSKRQRQFGPGKPFKTTVAAVQHALAGKWFWFAWESPYARPLHWSIVVNWSLVLIRGMAARGTIRRAVKLRRKRT